MVQKWMSMIMEDTAVIHDIMGHGVGRSMGVFYAENVLVRSQDPKWLQGALNLLIGLFRKIGLMDNVSKYKTMKFQTGAI